MPAAKKSVPSYLRHSQSGRARAVWTDQLGTRRDRLLPGPFDSTESRTAFARLLLELESTPHSNQTPDPIGMTVAELLEVSSVCRGLAIAVPGETWSEIGGWSVERMSQWLLNLAERAKLSRYPKTKRGPKKPKTRRTRFADKTHVATSRLLNDEQT